MKLEINLKSIKQVSYQKRDSNQAFLTFLKGQDSEQVDTIVHRLNDEITPKIDCLECGNCCRNLRPIASEKELIKFVEPADIERVKYDMAIQCKNLDGNKCKIYLDRHEECRLFPYLDRDAFVSRFRGVLQNYEICPIVFNVVESLKTELGWQEKS